MTAKECRQRGIKGRRLLDVGQMRGFGNDYQLRPGQVGMNLVGMLPSLWVCVALGAAIVALTVRLRESPLMLTDDVREALATGAAVAPDHASVTHPSAE